METEGVAEGDIAMPPTGAHATALNSWDGLLDHCMILNTPVVAT